jgi:hypothetical protein
MLCTVVRDFVSIGHDSGGFHVNMQICFGLSNCSDCTLGLHAVVVPVSHGVF